MPRQYAHTGTVLTNICPSSLTLTSAVKALEESVSGVPWDRVLQISEHICGVIQIEVHKSTCVDHWGGGSYSISERCKTQRDGMTAL